MAATITVQPIFAEVSDKIPGLVIVWFAGLAAALTIYALCRLHWSAAFFLLPVCLWLVWNIHYEFFTDIRSNIIEEQGVGYLIQIGISASLPAFVALLFVAKILCFNLRSKLVHQTT
jgi:hypothetical protein